MTDQVLWAVVGGRHFMQPEDISYLKISYLSQKAAGHWREH